MMNCSLTIIALPLIKPPPLNMQMAWLLAEGFSKVDCIFKYLNFAVFFGVKQGVQI